MPLNRRSTKALESIAQSQARLAAAEEKLYAALLDHFFPGDHRPSTSASPKRDSSRSNTTAKQPPKK